MIIVCRNSAEKVSYATVKFSDDMTMHSSRVMDVVREVQKESSEKLTTVLQEMVKIKEFSDNAMKNINEYASNLWILC